MLVSKCCKEVLRVISGYEGTAYYICEKCHCPDDGVFVLDFSECEATLEGKDE